MFHVDFGASLIMIVNLDGQIGTDLAFFTELLYMFSDFGFSALAEPLEVLPTRHRAIPQHPQYTLSNTHRRFLYLTNNLADKFPSESRNSPSEFGEMVENPQTRNSDGII